MNIYEKAEKIKNPNRNEMFDFAHEVSEFYRSDKNKEETIPKMIKLIDEMMPLGHEDAWLSSFFFSKKIYPQVDILRNKHLAIKCRDNYIKVPEDQKQAKLIEACDLLAFASSDEVKIFEIKKEVWNKVFENIPEFAIQLDKTLMEQRARTEKYLQEVGIKYSKPALK